ncbi:MAG: 4-(cytidine 5'-diphospho)-2-C-methyl-D-erythritol kinase [Clostridia bacterium]|nr:4-(cytidine 5'-diphospho)-2-C-methyl-D-erythritol kinase [Clostridia bacterium]
MNSVKIKSYAKINLTLEIQGVENGFHLLDSAVANIDICDTIYLKKKKGKYSNVIMHGQGSEHIPPEKNNALKAAEAFSAAFGTDGAEITVFKDIPIGAGLGGSSADICGVLNGMARLYGIEDREKVKALADTLGSDTGYMLNGGFARMQGRGERVTPIKMDMTLYLLVICPKSSVSAGACYQKYDELPHTLAWHESQTENCIRALLEKDVNGVGASLTNDLYVPALHVNDDVLTAYEQARSFSPLGACMSGSGSAVFALFETKELCVWAKSRYKGKFRVFTAKTIVPDYTGTKKQKLGIWRSPYRLSEEEESLLGGE